MTRRVLTGLAIVLAGVTLSGQDYVKSSSGNWSGSQIILISPGTGVTLQNLGTNVMTLTGSLTTTGNIVSGVDVLLGSTGFMHWLAKGGFDTAANGNFRLQIESGAIGSVLKVDALPTVASGFGTSPAISAGSTALAGSINVGTGGVATTGVINFNGTAFPSAPFCTITPTLTNAVTRPTALSTTQLTMTTTTAWTASDVVIWQCISAK